MRAIQVCIDKGYWRPGNFMCLSLSTAFHEGDITTEERDKARAAIGEAIGGDPHRTLHDFLWAQYGDAWRNCDRKAIITEWWKAFIERHPDA